MKQSKAEADGPLVCDAEALPIRAMPNNRRASPPHDEQTTVLGLSAVQCS